MADLNGQTIATTYSSLLKFSDNGVIETDAVQVISDGRGTATSLSLSTLRASIVLGSTAGDDFIVDGTTLVVEGDNNRVGIGLTDPSSTLEVYGTDAQIRLSDSTVGHSFTTLVDANTYLQIKRAHATSGGAQLLGFSDTASMQGLILSGYINDTDTTDTTAAVQIRGGKRSGTTIGDLGAAETGFQVSDSDGSSHYITVLGDGKVGIGETAPGTALDVKGGDPTLITINSADSDGDAGIRLEKAGTKTWTIHNDHGGTGGDSLKITDHDDAQGVELIQNDGDGFAVVSDERWKADWTEYSGALDGIKTLRAGKYKFKNLVNGNIPDVWNSGLIAQDVEKILPDCVHKTTEESDDGKSLERKSLSYQAMIPYLVKAVQELSAKVTALENA